ncbi:MAG: Uma2 family endonuclease, partial [Bacteroidetes bacterium]
REVWICDEAGTLRFFDADGERTTSALVPEAPARL